MTKETLSSPALDLSRNRFIEFPRVLCAFFSLERLNLYHNAIKSIPEQIVQIHMLKILDLRFAQRRTPAAIPSSSRLFSRNQLSYIPPALCKLPNLEVLIISNNKLVSLPEEIGQLDRLIELVSAALALQHTFMWMFSDARMSVPMISRNCHTNSARSAVFAL